MAQAPELSVRVETWGPGVDGMPTDPVVDLFEALERRGAMGAVPGAGGLAGGPNAAFGLVVERSSSESDAFGDVAERAVAIFLEACAEVGLEHDGIASLEVMTDRYLVASAEQPAETYAGVSEVAALLGVSRQRVAELRSKAGFPSPVAELSSGPVWKVSSLNLFLRDWERKPGRPRKVAMPEPELAPLMELFPHDELGTLLGASESSLRRYASGSRRLPDDIAARAHYLSIVVGYLRGAYDDIGVRRWFHRRRTLLDGRAPAQLLRGRWTPDSEGARRVLDLARALTASRAT